MQAVVATAREAAERWLADFQAAFAGRGELRPLFRDDSHWRDVLALTWRICTSSGFGSFRESLASSLEKSKAKGFQLDPARTPPREVTRAGTRCIEAMFRFETKDGPCNGVVRLSPEDHRCWTLLTALDDLSGREERTGKLRPDGHAYSRDFAGPNWADLRRISSSYEKKEPTVLVVGGGQAGLSIGARLTQRGIDTLVVDRWPRVGDCWRRRYRALTLHNQVHVNHLPYMPFPPSWPVYIPKDKLANWFEAYAEAMEINYWTSTEFLGGAYDAAAKRWTVEVRREGKVRTLHPRHVVMATGASGMPNVPRIAELEGFAGKVIHSHEYQEAEAWRGRKCVVIGTGSSGHDIAQDLHSAGAEVTIVQRSPTLIIQCDPSAQLVYSLYSEGPPLEDCDLITVSVPLPVSKKTHQLATAHAKRLDKPLLDRLEAKGFRLTDGEDGTGWQWMYLTKGGGYYFNVGCSDLIAEGRIRLSQMDHLREELKGADLAVLATGYKGQEALVARLFGEEMARRVGPIWGFGDGLELRNMFQRTPQPGLWFIAGSFAQCRIYSKYLALQLQAAEAGLL